MKHANKQLNLENGSMWTCFSTVTGLHLNTLVIKPPYRYKQYIWTVNVQQMTSVFTPHHKGLTLLGFANTRNTWSCGSNRYISGWRYTQTSCKAKTGWINHIGWIIHWSLGFDEVKQIHHMPIRASHTSIAPQANSCKKTY